MLFLTFVPTPFVGLTTFHQSKRKTTRKRSLTKNGRKILIWCVCLNSLCSVVDFRRGRPLEEGWRRNKRDVEKEAWAWGAVGRNKRTKGLFLICYRWLSNIIISAFGNSSSKLWFFHICWSQIIPFRTLFKIMLHKLLFPHQSPSCLRSSALVVWYCYQVPLMYTC